MKRRTFLLPTAAGILLASTLSYAGTTWDGGGADTNINTIANWNDNINPTLTGGTSTLTFGTGGSSAVVNTNVNVLGLAINRDANFEIANGAGSLTIGTGGITVTLPSTTARTHTISESSLTVSGNQTWSVTNNTGTAQLNVSSALSGSGTITKAGTGNLVLSGDNSSYTGNILMGSAVGTSTGILRLSHSKALGSGKLIINNGNEDTGRVELSGNIQISNNIDFFGRTSFSTGSIIRNISGDNELSGVLTGSLNGNSYNFQSDSGTLTISGRITSSQTGRNLTLRGSGSISISGVIDNGAGNMNVRTLDSGTRTLSGSNSYTGTTSIGANSTLVVNTIADGGINSSIGASSNAATNLVFANNSTLRYTGATASSDRAFTINTNSVAIIDVQSTDANLSLAGATGTATNGALTKTGLGTLTLTGTATNTGNTTIQNGSIILSGGNNRLNTAGSVVLGDTSTSGRLQLGSGSAISQTLSGLTTTGQGGSVVGGAATASTLNLNIASSNIFGGRLGGDAANENNLALEKSGAGDLTLTATSTYTGNTTVSAGKLIVNGNISTSNLTTVANGATLGGSGTLGDVVVETGGTLAPGNSPGVITQESLSFADNANFEVEINKSLSPTNDRVNLTGDFANSLSITNGANLVLNLSGTFSMGDSFVIISYATTNGSWNGGLFNLGNGTDLLADDSKFVFGGLDWRINYDDTSAASTKSTESYTDGGKYVTLTVIPEPSAALLGSLGVLALLRRRRA